MTAGLKPHAQNRRKGARCRVPSNQQPPCWSTNLFDTQCSNCRSSALVRLLQLSAAAAAMLPLRGTMAMPSNVAHVQFRSHGRVADGGGPSRRTRGSSMQTAPPTSFRRPQLARIREEPHVCCFPMARVASLDGSKLCSSDTGACSPENACLPLDIILPDLVVQSQRARGSNRH
eukprot:CAMPEP_0204329246 /NCGR_PEP_ID=MMETSP0469-20131031/14011_1 /ASSEMBLY_ACC=CAM_ASM_000384 /TAXON_ID=2969 /ORGANISM="Oxyrrhis marina" /LENGTH=173 /DNA_ID=CAMNT_0051311821 /DNA_START=155 /DNA_END=673 /DNA_ORIENTATION=+